MFGFNLKNNDLVQRKSGEDDFNYKIRVLDFQRLKTAQLLSTLERHIPGMLAFMLELNESLSTNDPIVKKHLNGAMYPVKTPQEIQDLKDRVKRRMEKLPELIRQAKLSEKSCI